LKNRNRYANLLHRSLDELERLEGIFKFLPACGTAEQDIGTIQRHEEVEIE
jgi:hypothetical protein